MKDERGLYYYPSMQTRTTRMYVRMGDSGEVEFRLWSAENPEIWDKHEWITLDVVKHAMAMYKNKDKRNPLALYDEPVALKLLKEDAGG